LKLLTEVKVTYQVPFHHAFKAIYPIANQAIDDHYTIWEQVEDLMGMANDWPSVCFEPHRSQDWAFGLYLAYVLRYIRSKVPDNTIDVVYREEISSRLLTLVPDIQTKFDQAARPFLPVIDWIFKPSHPSHCAKAIRFHYIRHHLYIQGTIDVPEETPCPPSRP